MKEESAVPRLGVESKDGSMALALGGFLQARYGFAAKEGEHIEPELVLPRARFYAFGRIAGERVRYASAWATLSARRRWSCSTCTPR